MREKLFKITPERFEVGIGSGRNLREEMKRKEDEKKYVAPIPSDIFNIGEERLWKT